MRIKGDETEDPARPKQLFPPVELCSYCQDHHGNFFFPEVLSFLQLHYGSENIDDGIKKRLWNWATIATILIVLGMSAMVLIVTCRTPTGKYRCLRHNEDE
ncbi:hypothetical protein BIW11_08797 [Tropilaelaps mercedesae]|uniref:Uncharacterized protein n=1 Tax=Tropilaelaps mercedesae TaxID=418985 RepID=A0A1V9XN65_9ACAR|nr:hypothetical protein BIW11_08797 [Tropilaelaps mercedesae]